MLLDVKRTFDELVRGLASTPEQARRVLDNRLYQNLSGTLAGTAEYMAVETRATGWPRTRRLRPPRRRHAAGAARGRLPRRASPAAGAPRLACVRHPEGSDQHPAGGRIAPRAASSSAVCCAASSASPASVSSARSASSSAPSRTLTDALRARVRAGGGAARERRDGAAPGHGARASPHDGDRRAGACARGRSRCRIARRRRESRRCRGRSSARRPRRPRRPPASPRRSRHGSSAPLADLRTLAARQEATLAPLLRDRPRARSWPRCRSSRPPPGSLDELDALAAICCRSRGDVAPAPGRGVDGAARVTGTTFGAGASRAPSLRARAAARRLRRRSSLEPVDLEVQVQQAALDHLELGEQPAHVGRATAD